MNVESEHGDQVARSFATHVVKTVNAILLLEFA